MKFEPGKFYRTPLIQKAVVYELYPKYNIMHGAILYDDAPPMSTAWSLTGEHFSVKSLDLINDWNIPHPAKRWEPGVIIEVSNNGETWLLRRFLRFDERLKSPYVTSEGEMWKYAKFLEIFQQETP